MIAKKMPYICFLEGESSGRAPDIENLPSMGTIRSSGKAVTSATAVCALSSENECMSHAKSNEEANTCRLLQISRHRNRLPLISKQNCQMNVNIGLY